ncbi:T9SS type A sorting domain-containing protein [Flavobacterium sp. AS60]|uniref:T9SS type A sorting domain-containing protein n=1 Tax=Flavobacterium anseongense TaxID=2910677 RepID=UPI001F2F4458|nr:T9SS type A sorting domain-containing protein [Flavobacterium sp. AS60]MCF6129475.1 T9SS type A sorting domain-containing protein [Flavobacterium sp. AS60]
MKHIITLISILYSINCFSQTPNPDLFQTWYLYDYYSTDDNIHHPVSVITPSISPNLTFTEASLSFSGQGACNSFNGNFTSPFDDVVQFNNFSATLLLCGYSSHTSFEGAYFSFLQSGGGQYFISGEGDNMSLVISTPIFMNYVFGNSQLHSPNFELEQIAIYPNPAKEFVHVNAGQLAISKIQIINSLGQNIKTINDDFETIATADLTTGIYILKMDTSFGTINKKIIKE